jgi:hypothetical protein
MLLTKSASAGSSTRFLIGRVWNDRHGEDIERFDIVPDGLLEGLIRLKHIVSATRGDEA